MKQSLRLKLTISHIIISLSSILLVLIILNYILEIQFRDYIIKNINKKSYEIVNSIKRQYHDGTWNVNAIENIGINALENGMIIKLKDADGNTIWDAREYNSGKCQNIIAHLSSNMMKRYPNFKGSYKEQNYELDYLGNKIADLAIGYFGPYYYTDNDIIFLNTLNGVFIFVSLVAVILSIFLGNLISKRISYPILEVLRYTNYISEGNYKKLKLDSQITEINDLIKSINDLAEKLDCQEKIRKRLTQDIAHELRTPLSTIKSHVEAMMDGIWEPTYERLKSCLEEIDRLNELVVDLRDLSKYENDKKIEKNKFNLGELIRTLILNFDKQMLDKNLKLKLDIQDVYINADKSKIAQAIVNLISNAIKFSNEGGNIKISLKEFDDRIELKVKDDGIGISERDLPFIFERFYRAEESRNRKTGGAGIGLSITKTIIELHNGKIQVNSKLNEGSEFIVTLPKT